MERDLKKRPRKMKRDLGKRQIIVGSREVVIESSSCNRERDAQKRPIRWKET